MTNALMVPTVTTLATQDEQDAIFKQLTSSGAFLPRLSFYVGASELVKQDKVPQNHYGLDRGNEEVDVLGKEVDVIVFERRFKAMDIRGAKPLSYYNFNTPEFQAIHKVAISGEKMSKCFSGTEFLMWVPSKEEFCLFYAANKSSKREAPKIWNTKGTLATMKSKFVKMPENSFQAIVCVPSSGVPEAMPTQEQLDDEFTKFMNPKDSQIQTASTDEVAATTRVQ